MKIENCIICGCEPTKFTSNIRSKGCNQRITVVECSSDSDLPETWLEHRVTVYGDTVEHALDRWNETMEKP